MKIDKSVLFILITVLVCLPNTMIALGDIKTDVDTVVQDQPANTPVSGVGEGQKITAEAPLNELTGIEWKWQKTSYGNDQESIPDDPSLYTIMLKPDGSLDVLVDCNRAGGKYTLKVTYITIEVTHSTRAMCPPESLDQKFLKDLGSTGFYIIKNGHLYIDLKFNSGTMKFSK